MNRAEVERRINAASLLDVACTGCGAARGQPCQSRGKPADTHAVRYHQLEEYRRELRKLAIWEGR